MYMNAKDLRPPTERLELGPIVVVEADAEARSQVTRWLESRGYSVRAYASVEELDAAGIDPSVVCVAVGGGSLEPVRMLARRDARMPVVIMDDGATAIDAAVQAGAYDRVAKPLDQSQLLTGVERALERRGLTDALLRLESEVHDRHILPGLVGQSEAMKEVARQIDRVLESSVSVAVLGESGTGKELIARLIHGYGHRRNGPFVAMNCAALPEQIHLSELLGFQRPGIPAQPGRIQHAQGGTLFLGEVSALSEEAQAGLLQAIEEQRARPIGGGEEYPIDVRLISATQEDLRRLVEEGRFREDLYMRLVVYPITVPPLRERIEDIPLLVSHFLRKYRADVGRSVERVGHDVIEVLERHEWPRNVRELENTVHRAMLTTEGDILRVSDLPPELVARRAAGLAGDGEEMLTIRELERRAIRRALKATNGSVEKAAKLLGMGRATLYRRLAAYSAERAKSP